VLTRNWRLRDHLVDILRPVERNRTTVLHERCKPSFVVERDGSVVDYLFRLDLISNCTLQVAHTKFHSNLKKIQHVRPTFRNIVMIIFYCIALYLCVLYFAQHRSYAYYFYGIIQPSSHQCVLINLLTYSAPVL